MTPSDLVSMSAMQTINITSREKLVAFVKEHYSQQNAFCLAGGNQGQLACDRSNFSLDFSGYDAVVDYVKSDLVISAESGLTVQALNEKLAEHGQWLPMDLPTSRLIDMVLSGDAGYLETGYGPVRSQVLGMEALWGSGKVLKSGGRVVKNVTGFDMNKLIVASRGHFALPLVVHLKLAALPKTIASFAVSQSNPAELITLSQRLLASALPFMAMEIVEVDPGEYQLLVQVGGPSEMVHDIGDQLTASSTLRSIDNGTALIRLRTAGFPQAKGLELSASLSLMRGLVIKLRALGGRLRLRPAMGRLFLEHEAGSNFDLDAQLRALESILRATRESTDGSALAGFESLALAAYRGVEVHSYRLGAAQPALSKLYGNIKARFDPLGCFSPQVSFDFSGSLERSEHGR